MLSAERLIRYRPLRATAFMDQGFLFYLNGQADSAIDSFRRARGLGEDNFEELWERMVSTSAYQSVGEDTEFMNKVLGSN